MFSRSLFKKTIVTASCSFITASLFAQQANETNAATATSSYNQLATLMIIIMVVLAFVIWGMGHVLTELGRLVLKKSKESSAAAGVVLLLVFLLVSSSLHAQNETAADAVKAAPNYGGLSSTTFYCFVTILITEIVVILFLAFSIKRLYTELQPATSEKTAYQFSRLKTWWNNIDKKFFTKAVPIEKEADVMLDHDYDGIRELDNSLPPWWKYGFYISIVCAVIYLLNFHVFGLGKNPEQEYTAEMENARIQKEMYDAANKDKIDENNVPMPDAGGLAAAKEIFQSKCWPCHGKLGEGGAGPNLTDDYWLHKGSLNDIYHTIKTGYPDKGMQSWEKVYSPKEISYLAGYIRSLHGTNPPNAKAPQGDLQTESSKPDSALSAKADTIKKK